MDFNVDSTYDRRKLIWAYPVFLILFTLFPDVGIWGCISTTVFSTIVASDIRDHQMRNSAARGSSPRAYQAFSSSNDHYTRKLARTRD